jgi:hypothetical protein
MGWDGLDRALIGILGVHVSSEEVLRLRRVAEQAAKKKQSIIFLPCHRSHVDYVRFTARFEYLFLTSG